MMPVRIELPECTESGYDVTILGVGALGRRAVSEYPRSLDRSNYWYVNALTLCDDGQDHTEIRKIVKNTDVLFVIADMSEETDKENVISFADLHGRKRTVLIKCGAENVDPSLDSFYDLTISVEGGANPCHPVEILLGYMYSGIVGIAIEDMDWIIGRVPQMTYYEARYTTTEELEYIAARIKDLANTEKGGKNTCHGMQFCLVPDDGNPGILDILEEAWAAMQETAINGLVLAQMEVARPDEDDGRIRFSLLFGKETI